VCRSVRLDGLDKLAKLCYSEGCISPGIIFWSQVFESACYRSAEGLSQLLIQAEDTLDKYIPRSGGRDCCRDASA